MVLAAARQALRAFFHPLTGGPEQTGWPFGRAVYASEVSAVLEQLDGMRRNLEAIEYKIELYRERCC